MLCLLLDLSAAALQGATVCPRVTNEVRLKILFEFRQSTSNRFEVCALLGSNRERRKERQRKNKFRKRHWAASHHYIFTERPSNQASLNTVNKSSHQRQHQEYFTENKVVADSGSTLKGCSKLLTLVPFDCGSQASHR